MTEIHKQMEGGARCTRRINIPELEFTIPMGPKGRESTGHALPIIVPPVYEKQDFMRGVLKPLWAKAERAIKECDGLLFFGYSFPDTDTIARSSFWRAMSANTNNPDVVIANPSTSVVTKYCEILGLKRVIYFSDSSALLSRL